MAIRVATVADRDELFANISQHDARRRFCSTATSCERDGDLLHQLRGDEQWHDVRVIVTAPWASVDDGATALPWGADDCVSKPFRVPELLGRVRTQLRASSQLRAARAALQRYGRGARSACASDAVSNRRLVDILHEVTGELSATEIYRLLAIRVARALEISHCSVVLARPGDAVGTVAAAAEDRDDPGRRDRARRLSGDRHGARVGAPGARRRRADASAVRGDARAVGARGQADRHSLGRDGSVHDRSLARRACSFCAPVATSAR